MSDRLPGAATLVAAQTRYQFRLLVRTPRATVAGFALPVVLMILNNTSGRGDAQLRTLMAGMAVLGLTNISFVTHAAGLVAARESGVLRRWRASPLPAWCYFTGRIAATVALGVCCAAVAVLIGVWLYDVPLTAGMVAGLLIGLVAGSLAWASVGTAVTALVSSADTALPVLTVVYFPIVFLSGAFGSASPGPDWLTTVVRYLPARPVVDLARRAVDHTGTGLPPIPPSDLAILGGWAIAGLVISLLAFPWDPRRTD